jgi:exodeoxyribonuclease-5
MELTEKQSQGLQIAIDRYKKGARYTVISGYAGTGKSTLVKHLVQAFADLGIDTDNEVVYTAFTGKACNVLQKMGNKNVSTLHKLLYEHRPKPDGTFFRLPISVGSLPYRIVVVDEISMVPIDLLKQLAKHPVYIICCGDPFQLPPVDKDADNHLLDNPHIFLDEIMRQAAESDIIQLSMAIREGRPLPPLNNNDAIVLPKDELTTAHLQWADQILCATNNTRVSINNQMRELMGRGNQPEDGDKIICLRNYWETCSQEGEPLVNGTIGTLSHPYKDMLHMPYGMKPSKVYYTVGNFISDDSQEYSRLYLDTQEILTGTPQLDHKQKYVLHKKMSWAVPLDFTYGYAITAHKAQGSQWDKVLVIEEAFPFAREEHARWLYTACTRASSRLVLVQK